MRTLITTPEYLDFISTLSDKVKIKIDYITDILIQSPVINTKFVKKLENTDLYEMRISLDNEYRVILFSINQPNIIQATQILMLNGFIKKTTKDYKAQIDIANKILQRLSNEPEEDDKQNEDNNETKDQNNDTLQDGDGK